MTTRLLAIVAVVLLFSAATAAAAAARFGDDARNAGNAAEAAAVFAPRSTTPPTITGEARVGETLTGHDGTWARQPTSVTRVWLRCDANGEQCAPIAGATAPTYVSTPDDYNHRLRLRVTAVNAGGHSEAFSPASQLVQQGFSLHPPTATTPPVISGTGAVDELLTAHPGVWNEDPTFTYQWLRCVDASTCSEIHGATARNHRLEGADAGKLFRVRVIATNRAGTRTATADATAAVARQRMTQILCANPDTGQGVIANGVLPEGFTQVTTNTPTAWLNVASRSQCAGTMTVARGVPLRPSAAGSSGTGTGGWLRYQALPGITYRGGTLHRRVSWAGGTKMMYSYHYAATVGLYGVPSTERCSQLYGCAGGLATSTSSPFVGTGVSVNINVSPGFNLNAACEGDQAGGCTWGVNTGLTLYGGKISLEDVAVPTVSATSGSLVEDSELSETASVSFDASDTGSGLYRLRVYVGDEEVAAQVVDPNAGKCGDVNPANNNDYEFAYQKPCVASVSKTLHFDTSSWPRGIQQLHVALEDGTRNTVTLSRRAVRIG